MEIVGYVAAALVFCAFYMRTMLPLRWTAIASNVAFLAYGIPFGLWPIVILHALLLPLNILRLIQLNRMLAHVRAPLTGEIDVTRLLGHLVREQHSSGAVLFRMGDAGNSAYYIVDGEVEIPERRIRLKSGQFFGEVGVFSSNRVRTGSAVCASAATLYRITERDLVHAFHQSPSLAFTLVRLLADRFEENLAPIERVLPVP